MRKYRHFWHKHGLEIAMAGLALMVAAAFIWLCAIIWGDLQVPLR